MVEAQLTPGRSSGRSFDRSGSFIAQTSPLLRRAFTSALTDDALGSLDGGPPGTHANAVGGAITTLAMSLPPPHLHARRPVIQEERQWRRPDILSGGNRPNLRLVAARWRGSDLSERTSEITGDYHMLSISLEPTEFSIWLGTRSIANQEVIPGTIQVTPPALPARIVYHKAYDALHVFIQNSVLKEFFEWSYGKATIGDVVLRDPDYAHDPLIGRLSLALLSADELGGSYSELYAELAQSRHRRTAFCIVRGKAGSGVTAKPRSSSELASQTRDRFHRKPYRPADHTRRSCPDRGPQSHAFRGPIPQSDQSAPT